MFSLNGQGVKTRLDDGDRFILLVEKFRYLTSPVYSEVRREEIISRVRSLEAEEDISDFTALLGRG